MAHPCCCISEGRSSTEHSSYSQRAEVKRGRPFMFLRSLCQPSKPAWGSPIQSQHPVPILLSLLPQKSLSITTGFYRAAHTLTDNCMHSASKHHWPSSSPCYPAHPPSCWQLCPPKDLGLQSPYAPEADSPFKGRRPELPLLQEQAEENKNLRNTNYSQKED